MIEPVAIHRTNEQLAFMNDPKSHWFGWVFYKHPDGQWVSLQNMNLEQMKADLDKTREENEELMKLDYWQDRYKIAQKELAEIKERLRPKSPEGSAAIEYERANEDYVLGVVPKLRAEVERLKAHLSMTNSNWPYEKKLHEELTALRSKTHLLVDALEQIKDGIDFSGWKLRTCFNIASEALRKFHHSEEKE